MPKYDVTIKATITKTVEGVEGENAQAAEEAAHEQFNILNDGSPEAYDQDTVEIVELEE